MKGTLIISGAFVVGVAVGLLKILPFDMDSGAWSLYLLYALLFFVGIGIGADKNSFGAIKRMRGQILLMPLVGIFGALAGSIVAWMALPDLSLLDVLAVGSGMGYYSLSSIMIAEIKGDTLATIALISNLFREFFTLLLAPFMVALFGKLAPIASGGATSMDTTLPVVVRFSGNDYAIVSIYNGVIISIMVPVLVGYFLSLN